MGGAGNSAVLLFEFSKSDYTKVEYASQIPRHGYATMSS